MMANTINLTGSRILKIKPLGMSVRDYLDQDNRWKASPKLDSTISIPWAPRQRKETVSSVYLSIIASDCDHNVENCLKLLLL